MTCNFKNKILFLLFLIFIALPSWSQSVVITESIGWLEGFIINSSKAVVVISHDRKFVDDITTRTIEVTMGRIYDYKATYSQYLEMRKERREQQMKKYEEQQ